MDSVENLARDMCSLIKANIGKFASEVEIRALFDDGLLDEFVNEDQDEADEALDLAIEMMVEEQSKWREERFK
jgi:hypothetical protein